MVLKPSANPVIIGSPCTSWNGGIGHMGIFLTSIHSTAVPYPRIPIIVDNSNLPEKYHRAHYKVNHVCDLEDVLKSLLTLLDLKSCGGKKIFCVTFLQPLTDYKAILAPVGPGSYTNGKIQISLTGLLDSSGLVQFFYIEGSIRHLTARQLCSAITCDRERTDSMNSDDGYIDVVTDSDSSSLKQAELLKLSRAATSSATSTPNGLFDLECNRSDDELSSSLRSVSSLVQWTQNTSKVIAEGQQTQQRPSKCPRSRNQTNWPSSRYNGKSGAQSLLNRPLSRQEFYAQQLNAHANQPHVSVLDKEFLEDKDYALANHFREQCARTACHIRSNSNHFETVAYSHRQSENEKLERDAVNSANAARRRMSSNPDDTDEPIEMGKHHHLAFHDYCLAAFKIAYCNKDKSKMEVCRPQATNYMHLPALKPSAKPAESADQPAPRECQRSRKHERKQQICPMNISPSSSMNGGDVTPTDKSNNPTLPAKEAPVIPRRRTPPRSLAGRARQRRVRRAPAPKSAPPTTPSTDGESDESDAESAARRVVEEEAARKAARDHDRADDDFVYFGDALRARRGRPRTSADSADSANVSSSSEWMPGIDSAYLEARAKLEQPLHPSQKKALNAKISSVLGLADDVGAPLSPIPTDVLIDGVSSQESKFLDDYLDLPVSNFLSAADVNAFLGGVDTVHLDTEVVVVDAPDHNSSGSSDMLLQDMLSSSMLSPVAVSESAASAGDTESLCSASSSRPVSPSNMAMSTDSRPELITVSMFWNDLPGLMLDDQEFVRLVDIHKQVLPAKPTGLLKSRCLAMNLAFHNCTELQRDFLIRYASADKSKSTLVVTKEIAKKLITYYVNPGNGKVATASLHPEKSRLKIDTAAASAQRLKSKDSAESVCPRRSAPKRANSSTCSSRAGSVDGSEESPSSAASVSTTRTASTTDTSGYYSTEPGSGGGGSTGAGVALSEEYSSGEEPRRKRYKVNKRSLHEIAKERKLLKKRQKQLRKKELELMKNTIRQLYTPSKTGGYPRWKDSDTEMVLLPANEPPTRPHPPDMEAWERAGSLGGSGVGRPARRGGNCLDLMHFDVGDQGVGKRSQQAGKFHFHLYLARHAACVQCHSCDLYFNLEEFALHTHVATANGQLGTVAVAQQIELRNPYPTEMEVRLWQRLMKTWRGFCEEPEDSPAPPLTAPTDSDGAPTTGVLIDC